MQNSDYNTSPYYYPQQPYSSNPNPDPIIPDPSYASAPPYSPTPTPTPSNYPYSFPDHQHLPTTPSSYPQQPQPSYSFPQFHSAGPYQPPYDHPSYNNNPNPSSQQYQSLPNDQYNNNNTNLFNLDDNQPYAYKGSNEPYGARGTKTSSGGGFDDFGRPIGKEQRPSNSVVRAVPKMETTEDGKGGVQKFRVKLLAESVGQTTMDVLCQIGLDGIRMLDPSTNRTLRIYLLDAITRCEAIDSSTFAFWSKSSVDIEPRRIRLQSNRYTTNTLLDTVTAVIVQYKEIGGTSKPYESPKIAEQPTEKKKGFVPWVNLIKPVNEEKDHWVPDEAATKCTSCVSDFSAFNRKHHCRNCGDIFCDKCTQGRTALTADENAPVVRVCDRCLAEVSRRLSIAKESVSRSTSIQSHEDLAKKLQEEMERSCKVSSGSRSEGSGRRMKEVACPICTVHLQVQVPSSGSETIECGVCQHPFLVSSH